MVYSRASKSSVTMRTRVVPSLFELNRSQLGFLFVLDAALTTLKPFKPIRHMTLKKLLLTSLLGLLSLNIGNATVVYQGASSSYISFVAATAADESIPRSLHTRVPTHQHL